jgi:hypothetical protein
MPAFLHIIYNYDFFLACFYDEFLIKCSFISEYIQKNMLIFLISTKVLHMAGSSKIEKFRGLAREGGGMVGKGVGWSGGASRSPKSGAI